MSLRLLVAGVVAMTGISAFAEEAVKDNSFLIEEAYNQEPGVVQFIQAYQYLDPAHEWNYSFTSEIPIKDEMNQFSFVIPVMKQNGAAGEDDQTQIGDILLNYRYQLMNTDLVAIAPRLSVIVPTGDYKKGFGNGVAGLQFNQAVSLTLNDKWTNHWNAGFTFTPDAKNADGDTATLFGYNFGTSVVYNVTPKTNLLCEFAFNSNETVVAQDTKAAESTYYVVPGIRTAFQAGQETEIVPGIAALLGLGPSAESHERGVLLYLSIESKLW
ncbi:transporter [Bdellovibrio sp. 22V]|uniref:transporter n=1 Tax=Bdellovibrio TaxID=958 RepID=UPI0025439113|nr:transporter [Bdellovibrio sp. 22V]WII72072.1 transporter [Bdellovibrio sp. 22V]